MSWVVPHWEGVLLSSLRFLPGQHRQPSVQKEHPGSQEGFQTLRQCKLPNYGLHPSSSERPPLPFSFKSVSPSMQGSWPHRQHDDGTVRFDTSQCQARTSCSLSMASGCWSRSHSRRARSSAAPFTSRSSASSEAAPAASLRAKPSRTIMQHILGYPVKEKHRRKVCWTVSRCVLTCRQIKSDDRCHYLCPARRHARACCSQQRPASAAAPASTASWRRRARIGSYASFSPHILSQGSVMRLPRTAKPGCSLSRMQQTDGRLMGRYNPRADIKVRATKQPSRCSAGQATHSKLAPGWRGKAG